MCPTSSIKLDNYTLKSRISPAMIVAFPIVLAIYAYNPEGLPEWATLIWDLIIWAGFTLLAAQFGRDAGKKKEKGLFDLWGGKPTTVILRFNSTNNKILLLARREKLKKIVPEIDLPTETDEASDPEEANKKYDACVTILREKTRDKNKYPLVYQENCNYGFRRNLWGLKRIGIILSIISAMVVFAKILLAAESGPTEIVCFILSCALIGIWVFLITPEWVKVVAQAYAERLFGAIDVLSG